VWNKNSELVGGLYGVIVGDCYIGESMFSREPNTSKLALINLAQLMSRIGGKMIDCQLETPHLKSMGGRFISYTEYLEILNPKALEVLNAPVPNPTDQPAEEDNHETTG
jgi:leucyl/phenylalanyl-tRNA--protein transferase